MKTSIQTIFKLIIASVFALAILPVVAAAPAVTPAEARAIAKEAYIYGYPMVDNYRAQYAYYVDDSDPNFKAPWNQIKNINRVFTPADTAVQTPNSDTPYSWAGLDLRAEPIVISVPAIEKERYYSIQMWDAYTYIAGYAGSRTTSNEAGNFMLVGPNWKGETPAGIKKVYTFDTHFGVVVFRTQLFDPADISNVEKIQAQYTMQPLSAFLGTAPPPPATAVDFIKPVTAEEQKTSLEFFNIMNFVLTYSPAVPSEVALRERFAKIGIEGGRTFDPSTLSPEIRTAIEQGRADAWEAFAGGVKELTNGKLTSGDVFGSRETLADNYLNRWLGTIGIYGNAQEEAMYPIYRVDSEGQALSGTNRYTLRFAPGEFPPVNAFWSLTMYELPSSLLVANSINRYLINSPMLPNMTRDADGGLTIYIQNESPGKDKESNWLPAPKGPFAAYMRLYWPTEAALDGSWTEPKLARAQTSPEMKMTTPVPESITTPARIETRLGTLEFPKGYPTDSTAETLYDYLDFMHGVEAFLYALPGASVHAAGRGIKSQGGDNQTVLIMEQLMDSKSLFLTANTESIYNMMWLDLNDGPLVVESPPNILGIVNDHWFQYVGDIGNAGPDKGKGGKYLLLPPGYEGDVPEGYHVFHSPTFENLYFWRGFIKDGSTASAVANTKKFARVYPLADADNPPPMKFINVSGTFFNTIGGNDFSFFEDINEIVQAEPNEAFNPEILGMLAAIGIEKGKPFNPDEKLKKTLTEAVAVGNATARTIAFKPRMKEAYLQPSSAWFFPFVGGSYQFLSQPGVRNLSARVLFHYNYTGVTPAMAFEMVGIGSQYVMATTDSKSQPLDGGETYKIHLPPNIPAKDFWSFVVYDNQTRSMLQTDQQFPSLGSLSEGIVTNADGSVDVWFGPTAPKGHENNWVQTVPGKGWNVLLRLYGPEKSWFDKTWTPGEFELVE